MTYQTFFLCDINLNMQQILYNIINNNTFGYYFSVASITVKSNFIINFLILTKVDQEMFHDPVNLSIY